MSSRQTKEGMTPSPPPKTKPSTQKDASLEDPFQQTSKPAKPNLFQPNTEPNFQAQSRLRSLRSRSSLSSMQAPSQKSIDEARTIEQAQLNQQMFGGHGHPEAQPKMKLGKLNSKVFLEEMAASGGYEQYSQAQQGTFSGHGHPEAQRFPQLKMKLNTAIPLNDIQNSGLDHHSQAPQTQGFDNNDSLHPPSEFEALNKLRLIQSQPPFQSFHHQPSHQSQPPNTTSRLKTSSTKTTTSIQPSHPEPKCTPTQITHQACAHTILIHSPSCVPTGTLCDYRPSVLNLTPGICARCASIPVEEWERMIKEKVERAVGRARKRAEGGELVRAIEEVDEVMVEVWRFRGVRGWVLSGSDGVGMVGVGEVEKRDVDIGQKVVDAIESLRAMMGEWVQAGGEEDEVRGRIQDVLGVGSGQEMARVEASPRTRMAAVVERVRREAQMNTVMGRVERDGSMTARQE